MRIIPIAISLLDILMICPINLKKNYFTNNTDNKASASEDLLKNIIINNEIKEINKLNINNNLNQNKSNFENFNDNKNNKNNEEHRKPNF